MNPAQPPTLNQPVEIPIPPNPQTPRSPKVLIFLLIGAVVVSGIYFLAKGYFAQKTTSIAKPTSVSSADWPVYKNDTYGFNFKYPQDWKLQEKVGPNSDQAILSLTSPETTQKVAAQKTGSLNYGSLSEYDFSIYYYETAAEEIENKSNNWGATKLDELIAKSNGVIKQTSVTKLGEASALEVIWSGESVNYAILATKNNHLYKLFFANRAAAAELSLNEKEILKTFQFNSATSTADWKTYTNTKYNYSIKCPANFNCEFFCGEGATEFNQFCASMPNSSDTGLGIDQYQLGKTVEFSAVSSADLIKILPTDDPLAAINKQLKAVGWSQSSDKLTLGGSDLQGYYKLYDSSMVPSYHGTGPLFDYSEDWFLVKDNVLFSASFRYVGDKIDSQQIAKKMVIVKQILSTFQFSS